MTWSDFLKVLQALVPLGALMLAGFSQYFAYKERSRSLREHLWVEQLRAARAINLAAVGTFDAVDRLEQGGCDTTVPSGRDWAREDDAMVAAHNGLTDALEDALMVLPEAGISAAVQFKNELDRLFASEVTFERPVSDQLWDVLLQVLIGLRETLGVDALSQATARAVRQTGAAAEQAHAADGHKR